MDRSLSILVTFTALTMFLILANQPAYLPTGAIVGGVPAQRMQTLIITGIDLNDFIGSDFTSLTGRHLTSLAGGVIHTDLGTTSYRPIIRLRERNSPSFDGGTLTYTKDKEDAVSDFVVFTRGEPLFEYELVFSPGLTGSLEDGVSEDIEGKILLLMGRPAAISRLEVSGSRVKIRFFTGSGEIELEDSSVTDNTFESGARVNGRNVDADVRIKGTVSSSRVVIHSIRYRPLARHKTTGNLFIAPHHGIRGYLEDPDVLLNPSFDLIYGGLGAGRRSIGTGLQGYPATGDSIEFKPSGDDEYRLYFSNNRGKRYTVPLYHLDGSVSLGDGTRDLVVSEGSSTSDYNIDIGDYFIISSGDDINDDTSVLRLKSVLDNTIVVDDITGGQTEASFDGTGTGSLTIAGTSYTFYANTSSDKIVVDQNNDGSFSSATVRIVTKGGVQLSVTTSSVTVRAPRKLFKDSSVNSDETTTISVTTSSGDIDLEVANQGNLTLSKATDRVRRGMTQYGLLFALDDTITPANLRIDVPRGQVTARATVQSGSGQSRGWIVITTERERFVKE